MKDLTFLKENYIAHRGLYDNKEIFENTLSAFIKAMNKKYIIELDVHLTKDNELVVFHDNNLERLTGINKHIRDLDYEEIRKIKLKNGSKIPKLDEVFDIIDNRVPILIEIKSENNIGTLEPILAEKIKNYKGRVAIQSFSSKSIMWFKRNEPDIIRGILIASLGDINIKKIYRSSDRSIVVKSRLRVDFVSLGIGSSIRRVERLNKKYMIIGWTVRDEETFERINPYYDNLICENIL